MGHEAFMERCAEDAMARGEDALFADTADMSEFEAERYVERARDVVRRTCDMLYRDVNVCTDTGPVYVMGLWRPILAAAEEQLADPLTRADEYRALEAAKLHIEAEKAALDDLIAGRTDYCDPSRTGE